VTVTFPEFENEALQLGFDEVIERSWDSHLELGTHTHPFAARAIVVRGEMWLTVEARTRHLRPGDTFELAANVPHSERYGAEGATYWVARRHGASTADKSLKP
jgi:mannose-6-phosphate isomerase-like protein (cupin superfamily)